MTTAYIYIWIHKPTLKWYLGSRTKENCHPDDGYICSSKIVKPLIKNMPSEWERKIIFTGSSIDVIQLENELLELLDSKNDPRSYNLHNGDGRFSTAGMTLPAEWVEKIRKGNTGKIRSESAKENYRRANSIKAKDPEYLNKLRKPKSADHGKKVSESMTGKKKSDAHRKAMSNARKGKLTGPCSDGRRNAISKALKGKHTLPIVMCPHCGLEGRANMNRWHFNNCKKKKI
jgi:hypothetical protein